VATVALIAAVGAPGVGLPDGHGKHGIQSQLIVVVQVLAAERERVDPLRDEFLGGVLDAPGIAEVDEALREAADDAELRLQLAQEKSAAVEAPDHLAPPEGNAPEPLAATRCLHGASLFNWHE